MLLNILENAEMIIQNFREDLNQYLNSEAIKKRIEQVESHARILYELEESQRKNNTKFFE
jgi:hypothetical protein